MASSDELRASQEELTRAIRELAEKERQAAIREEAYNRLHGIPSAGSGQMGPLPPVAVTPAPAASFWSEKSTSVGVSAIREALAGTGAGTAAGILGGLAGGMPGLAASAAQFGGQAFHDLVIRPQQAELDARQGVYRNSGAFASDDAVRQRASYAGATARIQSEDSATDRFLNWHGRVVSGLVTKSQDEVNAERGERERISRQDSERFDSVTGDVQRRTEQFFSAFAQGGSRPSEDQITAIAKFFKLQADTSFAIHADVERVVTRIQAGAPGQASLQKGN